MVEGKEGRPFFRIKRIISGGQTGVDRAALDAALELGLSCGGWCPKGRRAEDGRIDARYPLQETSSTNYAVRTGKNVRDSDGTLVLTGLGQTSAGTALTIKLAQKHKKPFLVVELLESSDLEVVRKWIETNCLSILNIAGPRESEVPEIQDKAFKFLKELFMLLKADQEQQVPPQQS